MNRSSEFLFSFAAFEREMISDRLRDAHASHRSRGRRSAGRVPLGYTADRATRQLVIDPETSHVVREIFERCASGKSARTIAEWANANGFRSKVHARGGGALWSARTILELLRNPVYRGDRRHESGVVRAVHEAIVDKELAARVDAALARRRTRPAASRRDGARDDDAFKLRGMLRCAACERVMTTTSSRARGSSASTTHRYYRCRGTPTRPACEPAMQVAAAPIEGALFEAIGRTILEGSIEARDMVFFLRLRPLWRVLSKQETWALLRQVIWILEVTRDGPIGHIGFDTVMIDVLAAEEPTFFANLPPRFGSSRFDRVLGHALLRMRARGAFGPHGAVSTYALHEVVSTGSRAGGRVRRHVFGERSGPPRGGVRGQHALRARLLSARGNQQVNASRVAA
jgi:hypothetical protein